MTGRINVVVVGLLAWLAVVNSTPTPFPHGRTLVYDYYGDVKAGIIEPAAYASQYAIAGKLNIRHDSRDASLKRAYYVALTDVKTGLHNGLAQHFQKTNVNTSIPEAANAILQPFLMVYNDLGQLKGVKISGDEPGWSRNMKMAIASMLQLDLANVQLDKAFRPQSYMAQEKTVHGDCWTSYDIHSRDPEDAPAINLLTVYKFSSPRNCSNYEVHSFNHVDVERCDLPAEAPMNMAARRVFQVENQGQNLLIQSLVAHGGANYFPWKGRSEAHYILNNASFVLERNVDSSEIDLPEVDFLNLELIRDLSYSRRLITYDYDATVDLSQGRHNVNQSALVPKVKKLLEAAVDYLKENHLNAEIPDIKHGQVINEILHQMSFMNSKSLYDLYDAIDKTETPDNVIKNLFLDILGHVGTLASTLFAVDLAMDHVTHRLNVLQAVSLLANIPLNVRNPSMAVLHQMQDHLVEDSLSPSIRKASLLSVASLINRIFKDDPNAAENTTVIKYLTDFMDRLKTDPSYEMKIVYLMAIKNIQVGNIAKYLAPVIRGDIQLSDRPAEIRLMAILAVQKAVANDYNAAHDLLWPVMADYKAPLKVRIAAYDILIRQAPTMTNILHIYWFMVYEKNEHLYNYHHMTIQGLANSVDPCQSQLRELATKIMRFTRIHSPVPYKLSTSHMFDVMDDVYGHGEKFGISIVRSERTGLPEVVHVDHVIVEGRKPVNNLELYLSMKGFEKEILTFLSAFAREPEDVSDEKVLKMLQHAAHHVPLTEDSFMDLVQIKHGKVINVLHLDGQVLTDITRGLSSGSLLQHMFLFRHLDTTKVSLDYDYLYEKHIVSEMGLPVILQNRVPRVQSFKFELSDVDVARDTANLKLSMKMWRHGDYSMSIYNPMMDIWHTIKRTTSVDAVLPLQVSFNLNLQDHGLQMHIPRLPLSEFSAAGIKSHASDLTVITQDDNDVLLSACPTCSHHEIVSKGPGTQKKYEKALDSKDSGLQYSMEIFDCESGVDPIYLHREHHRILSQRQNSWNDILLHVYLAGRMHFKNVRLISPEMGSCGLLLKIAPSMVHPTSHLDVNLRLSIEELTNSTVRPLNREKISIRGSVDAISSETNTSNRKWYLNMNVDLSPDHVENVFNIYLTRITPGEQNLKICIDGSKNYPELPLDLLKLGLTREQTHSKLTISAAHTDENECDRDQMLVVITTTAGLSEEQRESFIDDSMKSSCSRNMKNPLFESSTNLVPKTIACYDQAIKHTTLRKYDIEVTHKNVPRQVVSKLLALEDTLRAVVLPHVVYTSNSSTPGTVNIDVEFPLKLDTVNVSVMTPSRSYDLVDVDLEADNFPPRHVGFGPDVEKHLWMFPLDNTRFSTGLLIDYTSGSSKLCSLYRNVALTFDGGEFAYEIPRNWSMVTGLPDYFATFVKNIDDKLALRVYLSSHLVQILPVDGSVDVIVDNEPAHNVIGSGDAFKSKWMKLTNHGQHIILQIENPSVIIVYTVDSVTVMMYNDLQGLVAGLCGHMDGRHLKHIPHALILNED